MMQTLSGTSTFYTGFTLSLKSIQEEEMSGVVMAAGIDQSATTFLKKHLEKDTLGTQARLPSDFSSCEVHDAQGETESPVQVPQKVFIRPLL